MDVKVGSGAFLPDLDSARELARAIIEVAEGNGLRTAALLTDMNQVLGGTAGNALEVRECLDALTGAGTDPRLREVTLALSAELLVLGGLAEDATTARARAAEAFDHGAAAERFAAMVAALGGPADLLERPDDHLPAAPVACEVHALGAGRVTAIDVRAVGVAIVGLGGGRARESDPVDHAVGLTDVAGLGELVEPGGRPLAIVHGRDRAGADRAAAALRDAYTVGSATDGGVGGPIVIEVHRAV
jgi:thymidine phosphorylase